MSGTVTYNPTSWTVIGNIINSEIGTPTSTSPFTPYNCSLSLLTNTVIKGYTLKPLKVVSDW